MLPDSWYVSGVWQSVRHSYPCARVPRVILTWANSCWGKSILVSKSKVAAAITILRFSRPRLHIDKVTISINYDMLYRFLWWSYMYVESGMIEKQLNLQKSAPSALLLALGMFSLEARSSHAHSLFSVSASQHYTESDVTRLWSRLRAGWSNSPR